MTPVYQTIISGTEGNCMQAAIASLLDMKLEEVPDFKKSGHLWMQDIYRFLWNNGYEYHGSIRNPRDFGSWGEDRMSKIKELSPGIDGFYFAIVYSPTFANFSDFNTNKSVTTHAVIVDSNCNILHDPNPDNKDRQNYPGHLKLDYNGVLEVFMIEHREGYGYPFEYDDNSEQNFNMKI